MAPVTRHRTVLVTAVLVAFSCTVLVAAFTAAFRLLHPQAEPTPAAAAGPARQLPGVIVVPTPSAGRTSTSAPAGRTPARAAPPVTVHPAAIPTRPAAPVVRPSAAAPAVPAATPSVPAPPTPADVPSGVSTPLGHGSPLPCPTASTGLRLDVAGLSVRLDAGDCPAMAASPAATGQASSPHTPGQHHRRDDPAAIPTPSTTDPAATPPIAAAPTTDPGATGTPAATGTSTAPPATPTARPSAQRSPDPRHHGAHPVHHHPLRHRH